MGTHRHLRLVTADEKPPIPTVTHPSITTVDAARAAMRLYAAIVEAPPTDLFSGFTTEEVAAQYAATDRLVAVFRILDRLLTDGTPRKGCPETDTRTTTHEKKENEK